MEQLNSPLYEFWNKYDDGTAYSVHIPNELYVVSGGMIALSQIPDMTYGVTLEYRDSDDDPVWKPLKQVKTTKQLDAHEYRIDWQSGWVWLNGQDGIKYIRADYYGRGFWMLDDKRIMAAIKKKPDGSYDYQSLNDILSYINGYLHRGEWGESEVYEPGNQVYRNGTTYIALKKNSGIIPWSDEAVDTNGDLCWMVLSGGLGSPEEYNSHLTYYNRDLVFYKNAKTTPPVCAIFKCIKEAAYVEPMVAKDWNQYWEKLIDVGDMYTDIVGLRKDLDEHKKLYGTIYDADISKVGSGNNVLYITVDGITSYDQLNGKTVQVFTGAYSNTNATPAQIYLNVNGLGNKAIRRPITTVKAGYDEKEYFTDVYYAREINRNTLMELTIRGGTAIWTNATPPVRATSEQMAAGAEESAYVTPKLVGDAKPGLKMSGKTVKPTSDTTVTAGEGAEIFNDYRERTYSETMLSAGNVACGVYSHAEGECTTANGHYSHAEGGATKASGMWSHTEGSATEAIGEYSHAEGSSTKAIGDYSHAGGDTTTASGEASHTEGASTKASGYAAHTEGSGTEADGDYSHAEGVSTKASGDSQHVQGKFNIDDTQNKFAHIVGNGTYNARSNAHTLDWDGNAWFAGDVTVGAGNDVLAKQKEIGTLSDLTTTDKTNLVAALNALNSKKADTTSVLTKDNTDEFVPSGDYQPATKKYVDNIIIEAGAGDMLRSIYDSDNDGKVNSAVAADSAGNAAKLGGQEPGHYAVKSETAPTSHAVNNTTYGAGSSSSYGHVRLSGSGGANDYVLTVGNTKNTASLNDSSFLYCGEHPLSFTGTVTGGPSGLLAGTIYYGVLKTESPSATSMSTSYGVKQTLTIPMLKKTWYRYCYVGSATFGAWTRMPESITDYTVSIPTNWTSESGYYTQTVALSGLQSDDDPIVDVLLSADAAAARLQLEAFQLVNRITTQADRMILYCYGSMPTVAFNLHLKVVR